VRRLALAAICIAALVAFACGGSGGGDASGDDGGSRDGDGGIYVFDLNTGQLERISDDPAFELAWTADGAQLWYATSFAPGDDGDVREIDVASGDSREIAPLDGAGFATFAPDAGYVAFIARDGTSYTPTLRTPYGGFVTYDDGLGAQLRPDGAYLLFVSPPCAATQSLHIVDLKSGEEFVSDPGAFAASWLQDGRIALSMQPEDAALPAKQVILDPATRGLTDAAGGLGADPAGAYNLSPHASHVLYGGSVNRIILKKTGGGAENELGSGRVSLAAWSPDSSLIAYAASDTLYVADAAGTQRYAVDLARITNESGAPAVSMRWSPDGTKLALGAGVVAEGGVCEGVGTATP
jgi:Tol biopolymer transport system component